MKFTSSLAMAVALASGAGLLASQPAVAFAKKEKPAEGPKFNLSKPVQNAAADAQKALEAKDYPTVAAKLTEAEPALATDDDKYIYNQLSLQLGVGTSDNARIAKALDYLTTSARTTPADLVKYYQVQGQLAADAKDYPKAQAAYEKLSAASPTDPNPLLALSELASDQKNYQGALGYVEKAIAVREAAGQPVEPAYYQNAFAFAFNGNIAPGIAKWGPKFVSANPTPKNWRTVILSYGDSAKLDEQGQLDMYRLMMVTGAMEGERDYVDYADIASRRGLPGEALSVLDQAKTAGLPASRASSEIRGIVASKVAADKASLPAGEKSAQAGGTGRTALSVGDGYLSYGDWTKAAELYRLAVQKGGVDANVANTRLGIALARAGQKDAAKQAFAQVTGQRQGLAQYWMAWLDRSA